MSSSTTTIHHAGRSRVRPLAGLAAAAVLATAGLAAPGVAHAAAPVQVPEDCAQPFPVSEVTNGQAVHGLTVTKGTQPETFTGTLLGTLKDGIAPGTDMVLAELHSTAIDDAGIWEGMSGSPVYDDATGELIGAVSYTLSYGKTNIAGLTPFAAMQRYLPATSGTGATSAPPQVPLGGARLARRVAAAADVTPAQAQQGMSLIRTPLAIAGIPANRVAKAQRSGKPYLRDALATGRMGAAAGGVGQADPADLVAGGNLTAAMVYGEVTEAGIGTVTSVCHGALVGFGHPMNGNGATDMTLMSADAVAIQPDPLGSAFKVANIGGVAGTINEDRFAGISGPLDGGPTAATFTATSRYGADTHTGTSYSAMTEAAADAAFFQLTSSNDAALQAVQKGGARLTFTVNGTDAAGRRFTITHADRYASSYDISFDSSSDVGDLVYALSQIRGVHLTSVTASSALDDTSDARQITQVQQRRRGHWVAVSEKEPVFARPGRTTALRLVLTSPGVPTTYRNVTLSVPAGLRRGTGRVVVAGGNDVYTNFYAVTSVAQARTMVGSMVRNDAVQLRVKLHRGSHRVNRSVVLSGFDRVVSGSAVIPVFVGRR